MNLKKIHMSNCKQKRNSLENFVKEQIIGPGAYNLRYFFIDKWDTCEFSGMDLKAKSVNAFNNISEVITEVPAYQYSSAILFPETRITSEISSRVLDDTIGGDKVLDSEIEDVNTGTDDDNIKDDSAESLISKQQNYPNSVGLTFVVKKEAVISSDLSVSVSFRKYYKTQKSTCLNNKLACFVNEYDKEIEAAINNYFQPLFATTRKDNNLFVYLNQEFSKSNVYDVDYVHLNNYLKAIVIPFINSSFDSQITELKSKDRTKYFGIKGERDIILYSINASISYSEIEYTNVFTLYDSAIIGIIKASLCEDLINYSKYKSLIEQIEIFNQLKTYVTDLKSIYKPRNSSPVWESKSFEKIDITLPKFDLNKRIFRESNLQINKGIKEIADLKYSVQYILKDNEIFVKIVLLNKASITLEKDEPPQLNKKDEANSKSLFGVKVLVEENSPNILRQYNPLQLLEFDEEDNFNKLLYRNYHDYGEGYNTSVDWGVGPNELKYISTEYLPEQETPKVDFRPSKIEGDKIISRINESVLSFRNLSTLSERKDEEIFAELNGFIDSYKCWIDEKDNELEKDNGLSASEKVLLTKQILACNNDYLRLARNIKILSQDKKAIAAFRVMNTAMFMQLHHSLNKPFSPPTSTENFYKTIDLGLDDDNVPKEYKWRSFQLAFILLNIDAFVRPDPNDKTVSNVFGKEWQERNEIADLVWFPTGGGKTEAYLGIIAFAISYRRFTKGAKGFGTTVLMRYTLRLLTLQQFQRATILICALEAIRKDGFSIPHFCSLGTERISIGLFVGSGSLPNSWKGTGLPYENSMSNELDKIAKCIEENRQVFTNLPFTECPWCGSQLFIEADLRNVSHKNGGLNYGINDQLSICCNNSSCTFKGRGMNRPDKEFSLPLRLFDEDIYKIPPTLLFGTVDKFAALANKVSTKPSERNADSRRIFGKGYNYNTLPPELIIQDELHLLLGPLGSAVGLFEKSIDYLCTYEEGGIKIKPKIITSTATTRNTDKQIFALFNRRSEIFPKQGILSDDSFFAYYERDNTSLIKYLSNRKYIGILPIGKTQVWMQLRIAAIALTHRLKYLKELYTNDEIFQTPEILKNQLQTLDYYHTVLSYFNSLKDVGKTQSQLSHYLPGDINYVTKNTVAWSFLNQLVRNESLIDYSELTGRLKGEEVKSNLANIQKMWTLISREGSKFKLNLDNPPEFVISTNMISVGIDVSRFNTMIISSMPRNIAEYIQASSRVARNKEGVVFTIHHPFRSRDISHYQKFKEFHEKFYSYVEPISVTPFASKAMDRYLAMFLSVLIRHNSVLGLMNNDEASALNNNKIAVIKQDALKEINKIAANSEKLDLYLRNRSAGVSSSVDGIISQEEIDDLSSKIDLLMHFWINRLEGSEPKSELEYRATLKMNSLFISNSDDNYPRHWKVGYSLREIDPTAVIKTVQQ